MKLEMEMAERFDSPRSQSECGYGSPDFLLRLGTSLIFNPSFDPPLSSFTSYNWGISFA